jgi:hypothetical protein
MAAAHATSSSSSSTSLLARSLAAAAERPLRARLDDPNALLALPEELLLTLLQRVLANGRLTPKIAAAFTAVAEAREHAALSRYIASLALRDPPPVVATTARPWLGDKPSLY